MPSLVKREKVSSYQSRLNNSPNFVLIGFEKTTHKKMEELRKGLKTLLKKDGKTKLNVIKNSIFSIALKKNKLDTMFPEDILKGQLALLNLAGDWMEGLSVYHSYAKKEETLVFKGGILDGVYYGKEDLLKLAQLPSKSELVSMIIRSLKSSQTRLVFTLNYPMMRLVNVLKQTKVTN
jgi:large subunit ribosomal protein L10